MPEFNGFRSTTLIGKNDLPAGASVVKTPQDNLTIHEYIVEPRPASTTNLSSNTVSNIQAITTNSKYENYFVGNSKTIISEKPVASEEPETPIIP